MEDLHIHSIFSDGDYTIEQIAEEAKTNNVSVISVTDHDDMKSVGYIKSHIIDKDITFIPGIELSTELLISGKRIKVHILGLGFDSQNEKLIQSLNELHERRGEDNKKYIEELCSYYDFLSPSQFENFDYGKYGWIRKLILLQLKDVISEEQKKELTPYLNEIKPKYHGYNHNTLDAIDLIHQAGGIAIIAHPFQMKLNREDEERVIKYLKEHGLDGIEAYHSDATLEDTKTSLELAKKYNLFVTAGSDFHRHDKYQVEIGKGVNNNIIHEPLPVVKKLILENKTINQGEE